MYILSRLESNLDLFGEGAEEREALDAATGDRMPVNDIWFKVALCVYLTPGLCKRRGY